MKRKLMMIAASAMLVVMLTACGSAGDAAPQNDNSAGSATTASEQQPAESQDELEQYDAGMYKVGADIPAGEYILDPSAMAYYQVASDSTGALESIVSNDNFSGTRYITVSDGQYLTLTSCTAYPASYVSEGKVKNDNLSGGMYKVGVDIEAGEYKVTPDGSGYYEVDSSSAGTLDVIVANENFSSDVYVTVADGQYLKLSGATLSK